MTEQNKDGAKRGCDVLKYVQLVFPFFFFCIMSQMYLFFSAALFTVNSKMLNEFNILTYKIYIRLNLHFFPIVL